MIDSAQLLEILWRQAGWVAPAALLISGLKLAVAPTLKGVIGEMAVRIRLKGMAMAELHDCIIPDGRGGMTQVDHLYLTPKGIQVIETKNYGGRIFGNAQDKSWTQRIGRRSIRVGNPLRQNWGHVQAVKALTGDRAPVHGHVIVSCRAQFPKGLPAGVHRLGDFAKSFRTDAGNGSVPPEWTLAWEAIRVVARSDPSARKAHRAALTHRHGPDKATYAGVVLLAAGVLVGGFYVLSTQT